MNNLRWTNPGQPQTLQISVFLCYFRGVFLLLFGNIIYRLLPFEILGNTLSRLVPVILALAFIAGGLGIASERKWGYIAAESPDSADVRWRAGRDGVSPAIA